VTHGQSAPSPNGYDIVKPLPTGDGTQIYYWQVVYSSAPDAAADDKVTELKSEIRAFTLEPMPVIEDFSTISDRIFGTIVGDGTNLNLGHAAFVNSGVKINTMKSARIKATRLPDRHHVHRSNQPAAQLRTHLKQGRHALPQAHAASRWRRTCHVEPDPPRVEAVEADLQLPGIPGLIEEPGKGPQLCARHCHTSARSHIPATRRSD